MDDEMSSLAKNNTWVWIELPTEKRALLRKWWSRIKAELEEKMMLKAQLVVKGYSHQKYIDYAEIFSLVVKLTTIQILLSIVASKNGYLGEMDVKTTFLHGVLDQNICMQQPKDLHLQAKNTWYKQFDSLMYKSGFCWSEKDEYFYFKKYTNSYDILILMYFYSYMWMIY